MTVIAELSNALGAGTATAMIFFPITYYAMRKQFKLKPLNKLWRPFGGCVVLFALLRFLFGESGGDTPASLVTFYMLPIIVSASILFWTSRDHEGNSSKNFSFANTVGKPISDAIQQPEQNTRYPWWMNHLQSSSNRLKYAAFPFLLLMSILLIHGTPPYIKGVIVSFLVLTGGTYAFLTFAHLLVSEYKPWRERSKSFRLYCFMTGNWVVGIFVIVALFDPFNLGSWNYMSTNDYLHIFSAALVPPVFIGITMYLYRKFIS